MRKYKVLGLSSIMLVIGIIVSAGAVNIVNRHGLLAQDSPKTLYDIAKERGINGRYTHEFDATSGITYPTIEEVAKRSDAIVVGRPVKTLSYLSSDGTRITTHCWVKLQEILKGDISRKRGKRVVVKVLVPGGSHMYKDKTIVIMRSIYYMPPRKNQVYVLFLNKDVADPKGWTIVGGSQGQFELDFPNNRVRQGDLKKNSPMGLACKTKSARQFLKEAHLVARNISFKK